ncbi:hypothetical protein FBU30_011177 [Linnemannia zychae]|nr:hypothetical protein FBU30_011177 [Linnemannia zychae]
MDIDGKNGNEGPRKHLGRLRAEEFGPKEWHGRGYVLKGSIRTNGPSIGQYRRLPKNKLPNAFITTIGGTNSYLIEARNVFATAADVESLLGADLSQVGILSLDLGTSCVVGATVSLPPGQTPATLAQPHRKEGDEKLKKRGKTRRGKRKPGTIQNLESALPPLRREGASFREYVAVRRASEEDLDGFYNRTAFWKHKWDSELCRKEEFYKVAEGLLNMIGGSVGRPRMPHQRTVIAIGLAKFTSLHGPPGLDGTFQVFFINFARSLDYLVVGINEHYSSKRCPDCHDFVCATSDWRRLYCEICKRFWQCDRPLYLQPQRRDGTYPWMDVTTASDGGGGGAGDGAGVPSEAMDVSMDGAGGDSGGEAAAASPSIVSAANVHGLARKRPADIDPTVDTPGPSPIHIKSTPRKK